MIRSLLFAPASRPDMIDKAMASTADAVIVDLEDAVAESEKERTRREISERSAGWSAEKPWFVRVNNPRSPWYTDDLTALATTSAAGIIVPKCEKAADVERAAELLRHSAGEDGSRRPPALVVTVETALGVIHAFALCTASDAVDGLVFGSGEAGDLVADLGARWSPDGVALNYSRSHALVSARAATLQWAIDGVFMDFRNDDGLRVECELARRMGYSAKAAVHPRQIPIINEAFVPTEDELEWHRRVVEAFEKAEGQGVASIDVDGVMVDYAVAKNSRTVLRTVGAQ